MGRMATRCLLESRGWCWGKFTVPACISVLKSQHGHRPPAPVLLPVLKVADREPRSPPSLRKVQHFDTYVCQIIRASQA
eukprot:3930963-Pleurochrysis_carterae.AAC.2